MAERSGENHWRHVRQFTDRVYSWANWISTDHSVFVAVQIYRTPIQQSTPSPVASSFWCLGDGLPVLRIRSATVGRGDSIFVHNAAILDLPRYHFP